MDRRDLLPPGPGWDLTPGEQRLVECAASGEWWRPQVPAGKKWDTDRTKNDPAKAELWPDECTLRPEVIHCLITGACWSKGQEPWSLHPKGLRIENARIDCDLDLEGCDLLAPLWMWSCAIRGTMVLSDSKTQTLSFVGSCVGSIDARRARMDGSLYLRSKFQANGEVNLSGAKIGGQLICEGGRFENEGAIALQCAALTAGTDVFLRDGFHASGKVNFIRAVIAGSLHCRAGTFENAGKTALCVDSAKIGAGFYLRNVTSLNGLLDLHQAEVRMFHDDGSAWPKSGDIILDGFMYQRLSGPLTDRKTRLDWLKRQPEDHLGEGFRPQPWAQLIKVLREMGHERDARMIAIEREKVMARRPTNSLGQKIWDFLRGITVGYGYRPELALLWSLGFFLIGWLTFAAAENFGYMVPRDGSVIAYMAANPRAPLPPRYTEFNSVIYAFDAYLPVIELGQDSAWEPSDVPMRGALPPINDGSTVYGFSKLSVWAFEHGVHRFIYWLEEVFGWVFVSLYIAGMSGIMKKE